MHGACSKEKRCRAKSMQVTGARPTSPAPQHTRCSSVRNLRRARSWCRATRMRAGGGTAQGAHIAGGGTRTGCARSAVAGLRRAGSPTPAAAAPAAAPLRQDETRSKAVRAKRRGPAAPVCPASAFAALTARSSVHDVLELQCCYDGSFFIARTAAARCAGRCLSTWHWPARRVAQPCMIALAALRYSQQRLKG